MKAAIDTDSSSVEESDGLERVDGETNAIASMAKSDRSNDWNIHASPILKKQ